MCNVSAGCNKTFCCSLTFRKSSPGLWRSGMPESLFLLAFCPIRQRHSRSRWSQHFIGRTVFHGTAIRHATFTLRGSPTATLFIIFCRRPYTASHAHNSTAYWNDIIAFHDAPRSPFSSHAFSRVSFDLWWNHGQPTAVFRYGMTYHI